MTNKPNVTYADRKAYLRENDDLLPKYREEILAGEWDRAPSIQAFARHRIAAERETEARIVAYLRKRWIPGNYGSDFPAVIATDAIEQGDWRNDQ